MRASHFIPVVFCLMLCLSTPLFAAFEATFVSIEGLDKVTLDTGKEKRIGTLAGVQWRFFRIDENAPLDKQPPVADFEKKAIVHVQKILQKHRSLTVYEDTPTAEGTPRWYLFYTQVATDPGNEAKDHFERICLNEQLFKLGFCTPAEKPFALSKQFAESFKGVTFNRDAVRQLLEPATVPAGGSEFLPGTTTLAYSAQDDLLLALRLYQDYYRSERRFCWAPYYYGYTYNLTPYYYDTLSHPVIYPDLYFQTRPYRAPETWPHFPRRSHSGAAPRIHAWSYQGPLLGGHFRIRYDHH